VYPPEVPAGRVCSEAKIKYKTVCAYQLNGYITIFRAIRIETELHKYYFQGCKPWKECFNVSHGVLYALSKVISYSTTADHFNHRANGVTRPWILQGLGLCLKYTHLLDWILL
jgi:hypothetical protein